VPARSIEVERLNIHYGANHALKGVSLTIPERAVTALIGPSGCGKSTFLRSLNRMNDTVPGARVDGDVVLGGHSIYRNGTDVVDLRRHVGMVFQKPNPFPKTVLENVVFGPRVAGVRDRSRLLEIAERCLRGAALWDEVKDRLGDSALNLSGGQAQRLCIARALAVGPEVLLMDEPCSALDPIATSKIEDLIRELKKELTVVLVTHNMQQAARCSDFTGFFYLGELVEFGPTAQVFENPRDKRTEDYVTGRFG